MVSKEWPLSISKSTEQGSRKVRETFQKMSEMSSGSDLITDELVTKYCSQAVFNTGQAFYCQLLYNFQTDCLCSEVVVFSTKFKASSKAMTDFPITREDATYAVIYGALFAVGAIANAIVIVVLGKG